MFVSPYDISIAIEWNCISHDTLIRQGVLNTTLCDKACQRLAAGQWFSPGTPFSSTNKTDHHDIAEILLNTIKPTNIPGKLKQIVKASEGCN